MSSGTRWTPSALNADPTGDVLATVECIFGNTGDCAGYAADLPLIHEPNTVFDYNSGSTYLLSRIALENRGEEELELTNFEWAKEKLFWKVGAHSACIEFTANQIYLGGAFGCMTARDWARMGLLFINDGVWVDGTRILPEGWIDYTFQTGIPNNSYGSQIWVRSGYGKDVFAMSGFRNENVYISPSDDLVITRNAMPNLMYFRWDERKFLEPMYRYQCFEGSQNPPAPDDDDDDQTPPGPGDDDEEESSSDSGVSTAAVAGGAVAGVVGTGMLVGAVVFLRRSKAKQDPDVKGAGAGAGPSLQASLLEAEDGDVGGEPRF